MTNTIKPISLMEIFRNKKGHVLIVTNHNPFVSQRDEEISKTVEDIGLRKAYTFYKDDKEALTILKNYGPKPKKFIYQKD